MWLSARVELACGDSFPSITITLYFLFTVLQYLFALLSVSLDILLRCPILQYLFSALSFPISYGNQCYPLSFAVLTVAFSFAVLTFFPSIFLLLSFALFFFCGDKGCSYSSCGDHGFLLFAVLIVALSLIRYSWPSICLVIMFPSLLLSFP